MKFTKKEISGDPDFDEGLMRAVEVIKSMAVHAPDCMVANNGFKAAVFILVLQEEINRHIEYIESQVADGTGKDLTKGLRPLVRKFLTQLRGQNDLH